MKTPLLVLGFVTYTSLLGFTFYNAGKTDDEEKSRDIQRKEVYARVAKEIEYLDGKPGVSAHDWDLTYTYTFGRPLEVGRDNPQKLSLEELAKIDVSKIKELMGK